MSDLGVQSQSLVPFLVQESEVGHVLHGVGEFPVEVEAVEAVLVSHLDCGVDEEGAGSGGAGHVGEDSGVAAATADGYEGLDRRGFGAEAGDEAGDLSLVGVGDGEGEGVWVREEEGIVNVGEVVGVGVRGREVAAGRPIRGSD